MHRTTHPLLEELTWFQHLGPLRKFVSLPIPERSGNRKMLMLFVALPQGQLRQSAPTSVSEECVKIPEYRPVVLLDSQTHSAHSLTKSEHVQNQVLPHQF